MNRSSYIWVLIIASGFITYFIRIFFIQFIDEEKINKIKEYLTYVPVTVLSALFFSGVFDKGLASVTFDNVKIYASIIAIVVAYFFKNGLLTIIAGMVAFFLMQ